ncbi:hypothetical protein L3Q82_026864 [Scortum barcoo]|uniref:Uncharacterized protein n=1 Tax=Scortum barcoo TaxID=214431 RepID=A0ACB8WKQ3_9TELE|nr:hypothetical protein L3Q82_026864 [Scortum barcoo]
MMRPTTPTTTTTTLLIHGEAVERVNNIKFLGIHITSDLTWSMNTAHLVKKAQQRLFFLRKLKRAGLSPQLLTNFYRATTESILCLSAAVWYGSCTAQDLKGLSPGGENSTGDCGKSSSRSGLNIRWPGCRRRPDILPADPTHPGNLDCLFVPLPSGKAKIKTSNGPGHAPNEVPDGLLRDLPPRPGLKHPPTPGQSVVQRGVGGWSET